MVTHTTHTTTILKSLADDTRLSLVRKLATCDKEVTSNEIISDCAVALALSQPTMSHHFQKLVAAEVITERKVGVEKYYTLNRSLLDSIGINAQKL